MAIVCIPYQVILNSDELTGFRTFYPILVQMVILPALLFRYFLRFMYRRLIWLPFCLWLHVYQNRSAPVRLPFDR